MTDQPDPINVWKWWCDDNHETYVHDVVEFASRNMEAYARGENIADWRISEAVGRMMDAYERSHYDKIVANYISEAKWQNYKATRGIGA